MKKLCFISVVLCLALQVRAQEVRQPRVENPEAVLQRHEFLREITPRPQIPFLYNKTDAYSVCTEQSITEKLFTSEMIQDAVRPPVSASLHLYRTDPSYSRVNLMQLSPDGLSRQEGSAYKDVLNAALNAGYIFFREHEQGKHKTEADYLQLPLNTGMLRTSQDCIDEALRRGDRPR